jgi:hypothetical protein
MMICSFGDLVRQKNVLMLSKFFAINNMEVPPDFGDLFALLNEHKVECPIVGGYALAFHGAPRYTGAIDILSSIVIRNSSFVLIGADCLPDISSPQPVMPSASMLPSTGRCAGH